MFTMHLHITINANNLFINNDYKQKNYLIINELLQL